MLQSLKSSGESADLRGREYLVCGACGQVGIAVLRELLDAGCRVAVTWNVEADRAALEALLHPYGDAATLFQMLPQDLDSVEGVMRQLWAGFENLCGMLQIVGDELSRRVEPVTAEQLSELLTQDLSAALLLAHAGVPVLQSGSGGQLLFASARVAVPGCDAPAMFEKVEAGLTTLMAELVTALSGSPVRVNCVLPGDVLDTAATRAAYPQEDPTNWPHPQDLARALHFLCSPQSDTLTGKLVTLKRPS